METIEMVEGLEKELRRTKMKLNEERKEKEELLLDLNALREKVMGLEERLATVQAERDLVGEAFKNQQNSFKMLSKSFAEREESCRKEVIEAKAQQLKQAEAFAEKLRSLLSEPPASIACEH